MRFRGKTETYKLTVIALIARPHGQSGRPMKDGPPHAVGGGTRRTVHRSTQTVPRSHDQRSWLRDR